MGCHFPTGEFVGKIILFEARHGDLRLAARAASHYEWWVDEQKSRSKEEILSSISVLYRFPDFDSSFGYHKEIPHSGKVLGGGIVLMFDEAIYVNAISQAFGALPRIETERLLRDHFAQQSKDMNVFCGDDLCL